MTSRPALDRPLLLNGFEVELPAEIDVLVRPMADPTDVKIEREQLDGFWFVHWLGGSLYCLRLKAGGPMSERRADKAQGQRAPWLLRARIDDVIEIVFDRYTALRHRPFTFLSQRDEIVAEAAKKPD